MTVFDDFSRFLETRLEEFLRNNPHLELQAILEQLREQEQDTLKLIAQEQLQEKSLEAQILSVAQDIQNWHARIQKAQAAGRVDLAQAAQEREAALLRQGNQLWGQMEGAKKRILKAQELLTQIRQRRQEVQTKAAQSQATQTNPQSSSNWDTTGWNQAGSYQTTRPGVDPLEDKFHRWEVEEELRQMKRNLER